MLMCFVFILGSEKSGPFEKRSFQKSHFLEIVETLKILESPGKKGASNRSQEILEIFI